MGLTFAEKTRLPCRNRWNLLLRAALLFAVWLTGCNNTCFTFTSNPPTGTIGIKASDRSPTCTLAKANGVVRLTVQTVPTCSSCSESGRIQHIFVSMRGIDVHPNWIADEDSPDWQELALQFAKQPLQVDLVSEANDQRAIELLGERVVPAAVYRQIRLRFLPNQPTPDDRLPEKNACGSKGFNCVVMADGRIQPLRLDGDPSEVRITSDRIEGASLFIPPDTDTDLVIELGLVWAWALSADEGVRLLPALTGSAKVGRVEVDELGTPVNGVVHDCPSR